MHRFAPLVLAAVAVAAPFSMAQDDEPMSEMKAFRFQGGTLVEFLVAVEKAFPEPDLVVFPGGLEKIAVPAMNVRTVDSHALFEMVDGMSARGPGWDIRPQITWITEEIIVVKPSVSGNPFAAAPNKSRSSYVRVYGLPTGATMDDTLGALEAGITMTGDKDAVIRFHEATGIIFIDATSSAQDVADSVLSQLRLNIANRDRSSSSRGG